MVYFIQAEIGGPVKIGFTDADDARKRYVSLQMGNPWRLSVLATMDGDREMEEELHWRFAGQRVGGEWFEPNDELVQLIAQHGGKCRQGFCLVFKRRRPPRATFLNGEMQAVRRDLDERWREASDPHFGRAAPEAVAWALEQLTNDGIAEERRKWVKGRGWVCDYRAVWAEEWLAGSRSVRPADYRTTIP